MSKSVLGSDPFERLKAGKPEKGRKKTSRKAKAGEKSAKKKAGGQSKKKSKAKEKKAARESSWTGPKAPVPPPEKVEVDESSATAAFADPRGESSAIGGGDPKLRELLRPEGFKVGQEYGFDPDYYQFYKAAIQFFYRFFWRVTVKGAENIPNENRAVLVANHAGILPFDGLMVVTALRRETGRLAWPLIEDFFYYAPVLGTFLSKIGFVRACQENAQRLLSEEELVLVFPEGIKGIVKPYRNRYRLQRFGRGGFVKLCLLTDSPVIPVAIIGSEEAHPILANLGGLAKMIKLPFFPVTPLFPWLGPFGLMPLPAKWTIIFGEAVYVNQFGPESSSDRVAVNRLAGEVKSHIQKMIDMEIGQRKSRWRG